MATQSRTGPRQRARQHHGSASTPPSTALQPVGVGRATPNTPRHARLQYKRYNDSTKGSANVDRRCPRWLHLQRDRDDKKKNTDVHPTQTARQSSPPRRLRA